jgi:hypothetical protein
MSKLSSKEILFRSVKQIITDARSQVYRSTNTVLLQMYWNIGKLIVEDEQAGEVRAEYGKAVLKNLSAQLTIEFGKGFEESNLRNIRQFYIAFPIRDALRHELSWTHYRILSRIENQKFRENYLLHAIEENWNTRTLQRNIESQYLGRVLEIKSTSKIPTEAKHVIKDPYIFEFLGMTPDSSHTENKIETAIISHLQIFLMELGKGFAFVARQ